MEQVTRLRNLTTGGPVHVDVRDGRIVRMVPLELDESDGPSWTIAARGRTFTPARRTTLSPFTVAHRSTIYSPKRILTPLKRVDFDPYGEPDLHGHGAHLLPDPGGEVGAEVGLRAPITLDEEEPCP